MTATLAPMPPLVPPATPPPISALSTEQGVAPQLAISTTAQTPPQRQLALPHAPLARGPALIVSPA